MGDMVKYTKENHQLRWPFLYYFSAISIQTKTSCDTDVIITIHLFRFQNDYFSCVPHFLNAYMQIPAATATFKDSKVCISINT